MIERESDSFQFHWSKNKKSFQPKHVDPVGANETKAPNRNFHEGVDFLFTQPHNNEARRLPYERNMQGSSMQRPSPTYTQYICILYKIYLSLKYN